MIRPMHHSSHCPTTLTPAEVPIVSVQQTYNHHHASRMHRQADGLQAIASTMRPLLHQSAASVTSDKYKRAIGFCHRVSSQLLQESKAAFSPFAAPPPPRAPPIHRSSQPPHISPTQSAPQVRLSTHQFISARPHTLLPFRCSTSYPRGIAWWCLDLRGASYASFDLRCQSGIRHHVRPARQVCHHVAAFGGQACRHILTCFVRTVQ